jgi:peptidoglycan/LPS O-acetylase OafA/YrhL
MGTESQLPPGYIHFAHTLRGIACAVVVFAHLVIAFGCMPDVVASLTGIQSNLPVAKPIHNLSKATPFSYGGLGVAIFFLVSGFVIPLSLVRSTPIAFIVSRFFRLIPTYACCLAITLFALYSTHRYFGQNYSIPWTNILVHIGLVRDLVPYPAIDGVVWTLEVECRFYLACILIVPLIRTANLWGIFAISLVFTIAIIAIQSTATPWLNSRPLASTLWASFRLAALSIDFMWMGTVLSFQMRGLCTLKSTLITIAGLNTLFVAQLYFGGAYPSSASFSLLLSYQLALALFGLAYAFRDRFPKHALLDRLANISYPLYALHGTIGYCLETILFQWTGNHYVSILFTLPLVLLMASAVHHAIELPTQRAGKLLSKQWSKRPQPTPQLQQAAIKVS